MIHEWYRKF